VSQFLVPPTGFCGPVGPVDLEAAGEQALGLRCTEGHCCALATPTAPEPNADGEFPYDVTADSLAVRTC